ncbi:PIN domain-containing protein [Nostoc cf. edaphicum LEGE 07299]|uniref:PIN domain-containing protein n=1 Tax=Nostoc cf. edaphicum LEGE 07299 TaxID=2777974 RepID=A0ABR9TYC0_9NOSO|nr:PIN domain-containing protein [Nostoc edaphicum]MBE9105430.1 PIN domain-containing protein [Nostoc cf. edaphicum LEGE 07299]
MEFLIYLDVCCLNRLFDDQTQERIRLEVEAVLRILASVQTRDWQLQGSEVFDDELRNTPEGARKRQMRIWAALAMSKVNITQEIAFRGGELAQMGFKDYDALHIACAEAGNVNVLLTTDDRMLRLAARYKDLLQVKVENPLQWLREVANDRCE